MHHVAKTIQESFPDISDFASEFTGIHKASTGDATAELTRSILRSQFPSKALRPTAPNSSSTSAMPSKKLCFRPTISGYLPS